MNKTLQALTLCFLLLLWAGCASLVLRLNPALLANMTGALFEECDPLLAGEAIPANLKLLEGLLKSDADNPRILSSLGMGYGGYSFLFLESDTPERASRLYVRARDYAALALGGEAGRVLRDPEAGERAIQQAVRGLDRTNLEALFWLSFSWNAWIRLNLDKPQAIAQMASAEISLHRVLEIDETYLFGAPHILRGAILAAKPPLLGGNPAQAQRHFQRALELGRGKFFLAQYYYASYYAVAVQDRDLFARLLKEILEGNPRELEGVCLINTAVQERARQLMERTEELFY